MANQVTDFALDGLSGPVVDGHPDNARYVVNT
jgi:hypothetical protein